jgi:hypothetical protein
MIHRTILGSALAILAGLVSGCQTAPIRPCTDRDSGCSVRILDRGHVCDIPVAMDRLKLRDVLRASGRLKPLDSEDVGQLIRLGRNGGDLFIHYNETLITDTSLGDILIDPRETLEFVTWTETELIRGRYSSLPPVAPPPASNEMHALFDWLKALPRTVEINPMAETRFNTSKDPLEKAILLNVLANVGLTNPTDAATLEQWRIDFKKKVFADSQQAARRKKHDIDQVYFNRLYANALNNPPSGQVRIPVDVEVENEAGIPLPVKVFAEANFRNETKQYRITPPNTISVLQGTPSKASLIVIERPSETGTQTFILSRGYDTDGYPIDDFVRIHDAAPGGILLFDGDRVSLSNPDDIPIVKASLLVNKQVVQPALARQREGKCLKNPIATGHLRTTAGLHWDVTEEPCWK